MCRRTYASSGSGPYGCPQLAQEEILKHFASCMVQRALHLLFFELLAFIIHPFMGSDVLGACCLAFCYAFCCLVCSSLKEGVGGQVSAAVLVVNCRVFYFT